MRAEEDTILRGKIDEVRGAEEVEVREEEKDEEEEVVVMEEEES